MSDHHKTLRTVLPAIVARRDEIEAARRLPTDLVEQLIATGVFSLGVPRALGGAEIEPVDQLRVIETLSAADGSAGWCAMIGLGNGLFAGFMPERGAKEVYADPAQPTAASIAPTGTAVPIDGGYLVDGRWAFASGIDHATWVVAGCIVTVNGEPEMTPAGPRIIQVFVPANEVRILDTWHASGLRGTGSNEFEITGVFVPEQRVADIFDLTTHRPEPLYQLPILPIFAAHVAAAALGVARASLDELAALAMEKTPTFSLVPMAEKPVTQVELARAEAALGAARGFLAETLDDLWQTVGAGRTPSPRQHALARAAALQASETAARVTAAANVLGGGASVFSSSSLQRHARDAEAILHHATQSPQMWEECGRMLLGSPPLFPVF